MGTRTQTCNLCLRLPRATKPALCLLFLLVPHTQQRSPLNHDWPSPEGRAGEMKHFGVSELSKRLGCSTWLESRKRRGAGAVIPRVGHRLPLKMVHAAFGGSRGDESFCPWPDRAFQFLGEVELAGGKGPFFCPDLSPTEACPVQPCRALCPWCMWLCPFLLVMAKEGQAPKSPSPPRGTADGRLKRGWDTSWEVLSSLGKEGESISSV